MTTLIRLHGAVVHRAIVTTALVATLINLIGVYMNGTFTGVWARLAANFSAILLLLYAVRLVLGYGDSVRV